MDTGADHIARDLLDLDDERLANGVPLSAAFEFDRSIFRPEGDGDIRPGDAGRWRRMVACADYTAAEQIPSGAELGGSGGA